MASPPTTPTRQQQQRPASPTTPFPEFDDSAFETSLASGEISLWNPSDPEPVPVLEEVVDIWSDRDTWPTEEEFRHIYSSVSSMSTEYSMDSGGQGSNSETGVFPTSLPINAEIDRTDRFIEKCLKEQLAAKKAYEHSQIGSEVASQCDESISAASSFVPSSFAPSQATQSEYQPSQYQQEMLPEGTDFYYFESNVPLDTEVIISIQPGDFWAAREKTFTSRLPVPVNGTPERSAPDHSLFEFRNRITMGGKASKVMMGSTSMELARASDEDHEDLGGVPQHLKEVYKRTKKMLKSQRKGKQKATYSDSDSDSGDDSEGPDTEKATPMQEINNTLRYMSMGSIASIASSPPRPLPRPPTPKLILAAASSPDQSQMVLYDEPSSPTPKKPNNRYVTQLELLQSQISPVHSRYGGTPESQAARKLWRQAKLIHGEFPKITMMEQRIELNALRRAVGMEERGPVGQSQWQIDAQYRAIINALEKKFAAPRTVRKSISTWIDNTERARGGSSSPLTIGGSSYGRESKTEATPKASMSSTDTGYQSNVDVRARAAAIAKAAAAKAAATKAAAPLKAADAPLEAAAPLKANAPTKAEATAKVEAPNPIRAKATIKTEQSKKLENVLPRTSSGRVRLPIIASFREPLTTPERNALENRCIRLPIIAASVREPLTTPEKSALEHQKLKRYLRRSSSTRVPLAQAPPKATAKTNIPSPKVAGPGYLSPRRYVSNSPYKGHRTASGPSTTSRQAEDVWSEARQRLRGLAGMPVAMQRLELGAMRKAAGFEDQEVYHVADEDIIQVYLNEIKVLEAMWVGPARAAREAAKKTTVYSTKKVIEEKNNGKEREVVLERTVVRTTEKIGSGKGEERAKIVEEDEDSQDFEDVSSFTSPPSTPTPANKMGHPRPARPAWK